MKNKKEGNFSLSIIFIILFILGGFVLLRPHFKITAQLPQNAIYKKMSHKSLTDHIHVCKNGDTVNDGEQKVQINDAFIPIKDLGKAVEVLNSIRPKQRERTMSIEKGAEKKTVERIKHGLKTTKH